MAHFFHFPTLFHLSLTFFRPEVPFKSHGRDVWSFDEIILEAPHIKSVKEVFIFSHFLQTIQLGFSMNIIGHVHLTSNLCMKLRGNASKFKN